MTVTEDEKRQIKEKGYALFGGIPRCRYWTPDGREIMAVPSMRTFNRIKDGKVVDSGIRDVNLDNGWLPYKPENLKLYCPYCDKWHDTQEDVEKCGAKKKALYNKYQKIADEMKKKQEPADDVEKLRQEVSDIKQDMSDIKQMLARLVEGKINV